MKGVELIELNAAEKSRLGDIAGWKKLGQLINDFNPDVVQVNAGDTLKYAAFSRLITSWKAPLVYRNANKAGDFIKGVVHKAYNKWLAHKSDYVASVSANCAEDFVKTFAYPVEHIGVFPIGTPVKTPGLPKGDIRRELGMASNAELIVNVGSFVPEKNHTGLVEIFSSICSRRKNAHLVLIGDGKMRTAVEAKVREFSLQSNVHLLGYRNDAVDVLMQCNLMLMPSFIEGLPGVILEAMAHHIPVLASEIGGIPEVIHHNETGFLGNPKDIQSFVGPAIELLDDKLLAGRIIKNAFDYCKEHYDINKIADDFLALYHKVINSK